MAIEGIQQLEIMANSCDGLIIRILEKRDLEAARNLHNDDSVLLQLTDIKHISESEQDSWYESVSRSRMSRRYSILLEETGDFVGLFRLDRLDLQNRSAMVGLDIVQIYRGRGYAQIVYQYFLDYLFRQMGLNRLVLVTLETNQPANELYRSIGFVEEGRARQAIWRDGGFFDLIHFGLLREEYEARQSNR